MIEFEEQPGYLISDEFLAYADQIERLVKEGVDTHKGLKERLGADYRDRWFFDAIDKIRDELDNASLLKVPMKYVWVERTKGRLKNWDDWNRL